MQTLKSILEQIGNTKIEVRAYIDIPGFTKEESDIFFGLCEWKDGELLSLDGDIYSLDEEIENYEIDETIEKEPVLIVWLNRKESE